MRVSYLQLWNTSSEHIQLDCPDFAQILPEGEWKSGHTNQVLGTGEDEVYCPINFQFWIWPSKHWLPTKNYIKNFTLVTFFYSRNLITPLY